MGITKSLGEKNILQEARKKVVIPVPKSKTDAVQPVRTCCVCRIKAAKASLYRFVLEGGVPILDGRQEKMGRGAYCCRDERCLAGFLNRQKIWKRALKGKGVSLALKS